MSDHDIRYKHVTSRLPRLVAHREDRSRQRAADAAPAVLGVAAPLEEAVGRNHCMERTQAASPPLPAGFNPYFDLPPV